MITKPQKFWTLEEEEFLKENFVAFNIQEIAKQLERSPNSLRNKAYKLQLRKETVLWTEEEEEYLKTHYCKQSYQAIALALNRTDSAVLNKASKLGLKKRQWLPEEEEYFLSLVGDYPWQKILDLYNRWAEKNGYRKKTERQLKNKLKDSQLSPRLDGSSEFLGVKDIQLLLDCDKNTVYNLQKKYPELSKPKGIKGHDRMCFDRKTIKNWLINNPDVLERHQKKLNIRWLVDILIN